MKSTLSTETLTNFIPHRPPMVWVSNVISAHETGGICSIKLDLDAHYFSSKSQIRTSSLIEWMAQSSAYTKAAYLLSQNKRNTPKKAYLVGIKKFIIHKNFHTISHEKIKIIYIKIETIKELPPVSLISAEVSMDKDLKTLLSQAQLKLFCE